MSRSRRPTFTNLDAIEATEQLQRYRGTFPNLILTTCSAPPLPRWRLVDQALLGPPPGAEPDPHRAPARAARSTPGVAGSLPGLSLPVAYSAEELARAWPCASRFSPRIPSNKSWPTRPPRAAARCGFLQAFRQFLIGSLTPQEFADLYAHHITYGLFAPAPAPPTALPGGSAYDSIPRTIGILRDVFRFVSLGDCPPPWNGSWMTSPRCWPWPTPPASSTTTTTRAKGSDPIVHFYETFLAAYDPAERERVASTIRPSRWFSLHRPVAAPAAPVRVRAGRLAWPTPASPCWTPPPAP